MRYLVSLIFLAIGLLFVIKTSGVVGVFGRFGWAERHLGGAGTYTFYKLLGIGLIVLSMLILTGIGQAFLSAVTFGFFDRVGVATPAP